VLALVAFRARLGGLNLLIKAGASSGDPQAKADAVTNAAQVGDLEGVRALIAYGADPNLRRGLTTLMAASLSGAPDVVAEILKFHPDVNARDLQGRTAVRMVGEVGLGNPNQNPAAVIRLLAAAGADVNIADRMGNTALHQAADEAAAKALMEAGAKVDVRNQFGETPLMTTVDEGVARVLVEAGADVTIRDREGRTALDTARRELLEEKVSILEAAVRAKAK